MGGGMGGMGGMGMNTTTYKNYPLATFRDSGQQVVTEFPYIGKASSLEDLRNSTPTATREFVLNMPGMTGMMGMMSGGRAALWADGRDYPVVARCGAGF